MEEKKEVIETEKVTVQDVLNADKFVSEDLPRVEEKIDKLEEKIQKQKKKIQRMKQVKKGYSNLKINMDEEIDRLKEMINKTEEE